MSRILGFFGGKKEEPNSASSKNQSPPQSATNKQGNKVEPPAPEMNTNMFGNMQIKAKPSGGTKPKGFDPFNLGAPNKSGQTNFSEGGTFGRNEQNPMIISGQGSLTRIEGDETPTSMTEGLGEPKKVSAFGFMQKQPIKIQTNQPQGLSFVTNADPSPHRMYEGETANFNEYGEKRPSMTSLASEPVNTGAQKGPGSAFSFIKKKTNVTESDSQKATTLFGHQSSINLDNSSQQEIDASDSRSERTEGISVNSPPANKSFGGPSFLKFKSPSSQAPVGQTDESNLPTVETRSEHPDYPESQPDRDRGSETGSIKSSGPSFMKFKKKIETPQSGETPKRNESQPTSQRFSAREEEREDEAISRNRSEPAESKLLKTERIVSPLNPIQTPALKEEENPGTVRNRLEREEGDLLEAVGDLIVRQNGLVGKRTSLESQKENISRKLKNIQQQQEEAIEGENFEEADHLEVVILELNETLRDLEKQIDDCQLDYADLEKEKQMLYQNRVIVYQNLIGDIENIVLTQNHNFDKYKFDCLNLQTAEKNYIEEKTKELQHNRNHIDLDLKHINEETSQITENMDRQIKDYVTEQQDLSARKTDLEIIVDQIRRELKAKEDELADVSKNLDRITTKITNIKSKFDDSLSRINKKREKAEAEEQKYQEDTQKLQQHQEKAESSMKRLNEVTENHHKTLNDLEQLKSNFARDSQRLDQENLKRERAIKLYYDTLNEQRREKRQLLAYEDQIDSLKGDLDKYQKESETLQSQKSSLNNKVPELEREKKSFVASKSFKDASRVSNEIKDIQTKITEIDEKLQQMSETEKSTIQKIQTLEKETIPSLNERVNTITRDCDINHYELLVVKEKDLTLVFNYFQKQRQYEEANLVEAELTSTKNQISQLINQYPQLRERRESTEEQAEHQHQPLEEEQEQHVEIPKYENQEAQETNVPKDNNELHNGHQELIEEPEEQVGNTQEKKEVPLNELILEYENLQVKIDELEITIEQLAAEEKFDEADDAMNQQGTFKTKQEEILSQLKEAGLDDIEEAKTELVRRASEAEKHEEEQTQQVEEQNEENQEEQEEQKENENEIQVQEENNEEAKIEEVNEAQNEGENQNENIEHKE